jgi:hypothetical protein
MLAMNTGRDQETFRKFTLVLASLLTLVTIYIVVGGVTDSLSFARGYGPVAAALSAIVFFIFVLPALLLAAFNRLIGVAFALALLGLICYAFDPLLRLFAWFDQ